MWTTIFIIYLICAVLAWGLWIGRIRTLNPNGLFAPPGKYNKFQTKGYDTALVRAIAGPYSIWYTFKYEDGYKYGLKWK